MGRNFYFNQGWINGKIFCWLCRHIFSTTGKEYMDQSEHFFSHACSSMGFSCRYRREYYCEVQGQWATISESPQSSQLTKIAGNMEKFTILKGLPAYGDMPEQFTATGQGTYREGFVVEFHPAGVPVWVGNFQRGLGNYDCVLEHPDPNLIVVVAGCEGYVVNITDRNMVQNFGGMIQRILAQKEKPLIVFDNTIDLIILDSRQQLLRTKRISWDGFQGLRIDGERILGESWDPMMDKWTPFVVDLNNLNVTGGSYNDYKEISG
ncbi:MAG TPA: hypothetical protein VMX13_13760 [Sedimentisphaerales bacterium]|nr:hypothetical protein [Sedimentisphaerales bacterium]